jgi:hypothetical protein
VNEWSNDERVEDTIPKLDIRNCFTRSHPSEGENRSKNRSPEIKTMRFHLPRRQKIFKNALKINDLQLKYFKSYIYIYRNLLWRGL